MGNKAVKSILEVLFEKNICFTVYLSVTSFSASGIDYNSRDYSILVNQKDLKKLKGFRFYRTYNYTTVFERDMNESDVLEFKANTDKFEKVIHNQFGRVYELKNNSFKENVQLF